MVLAMPPFMTAGACREGVDPDLWFPASRRSPAVKEAKLRCMACPVQNECLEYALLEDERYGIWGGLLEEEREALRRRRRGV